MCDFCIKHGAGKKWYLNMMNYSREMEKDSDRRRLYLEIIGDFDNTTKETYDRKKLGWLRMPVKKHN